jgi:hypothetical protein
MAAGFSRRTALKLAVTTLAAHQSPAIARTSGGDQDQVVREIARAAEPLPDVSDDAFGRVLDRFGSARAFGRPAKRVSSDASGREYHGISQPMKWRYRADSP